MKVPFVDLKAQYLSLKPELDDAIMKVVSETAFVSGRYAASFEASFAGYIGSDHCVAVANGTDAIEIALQVTGVGPGDEVIVPANTFFATAEAVANVGAKAVFVDCEPSFYNIDVEKIEEKITPKTKAIIPVHLYGLPAEMDGVMSIARKHGLKVLEDCAQSHGADYKGQRTGTFGDIAAFSFYPGKNLGAYGDAGAIVTNDTDIAAQARLIANHGQPAKYQHTLIGRNSRMDGIQAAVLSAKLPHLNGWLNARRRNAARYNELLAETGIPLPTAPDHATHTYHLYVIRVKDRDDVAAKLNEAGIDTGLHYPTALPYLDVYADVGYKPSDFPVAHSQMGELLSLPMYPELTSEMIEYICETLKKALSRVSAANE
ncbi:MAG TPA: DegT/DnrJ/EryC1/StrS family aminotransferase [Pyrinomonadaceae bacterium]|nr:DegT/DnrJ/EryC1/StrS family aminotransferase [Pyrinomonadaceae bacterium]